MVHQCYATSANSHIEGRVVTAKTDSLHSCRKSCQCVLPVNVITSLWLEEIHWLYYLSSGYTGITDASFSDPLSITSNVVILWFDADTVNHK